MAALLKNGARVIVLNESEAGKYLRAPSDVVQLAEDVLDAG